MSVIVYNNIQLPYASVTSFLQEAVYEQHETDRILTKFDITAQCLVSSTYAAQLSPALANISQNPADFTAFIRQGLLKQRQALSVRVNGVELIPQKFTGNAGTVDSWNGPKPQYCNIIALNDTLFIVNYRIVAHYWENYTNPPNSSPVIGTNKAGSPLLYNRWTETVSIDGLNYSKRTRAGRFAIRSDNTQGFIVDNLRSQMAIVGIPQGFLRTHNEYRVDPSGLIMDYTQVDEEVYKLPPYPAYRAEGQLTVWTEKGASWFMNAHVELEGDKVTATQTGLVQVALHIALGKIANNATWFFIQKASLTMDLFHNKVSMDITCRVAKSGQLIGDSYQFPEADQLAGPDPQARFLDAFIGIDDYTPISDNPANVPPTYYTTGSAGLLLLAASYYDPSIANPSLVSPQGVPGGGKLIARQPIPQQQTPTPAQITAGGTPLPEPGAAGRFGG